MEEFPGFGPDFSSLAEKPAPDFEKKDKKDAKKAKKESLFERGTQTEAKRDDKSEKTSETPKDPPLEKLADDEKQMIVAARKEQVGEELVTAIPDSMAEKEALVAATFLELLETEVASGESVDQALNNSEEQALDIAGLEATIVTDPDQVNEFTAEQNADVQEESSEDDDNSTIADTTNGGMVVPPITIPQPTSGNTLAPPFTTGGGTIPPVFGSSGGGGFAGGNILPVMPDTTPNVSINRSSERHAVGRGLLVGGLIGYMIGRRRGRIKTEKKLLPIQHKLEKQVTDLQQKIAIREEKIRTTVREQVASRPQMQQKIVERMERLQELKRSPEPSNMPERDIVPNQPEQLGKFAMLAGRGVETQARHPEKIKDTEFMTTSELLVIAEKITLEHSSVKKLFEANRLDENGLRRVISAFLRGERYEHVINDNLKSPENFAVPETIQTNGSRQAVIYNQNQNNNYATSITTPTPMSTSSPINQPDGLPGTQPVINDPKQSHSLRAIITIVIIIAVVLLIVIGR